MVKNYYGIESANELKMSILSIDLNSIRRKLINVLMKCRLKVNYYKTLLFTIKVEYTEY